MAKKTVIKKRNYLVRGLPFIIFFVIALVILAAVLRIGIGDATWAGLVVSKLDGELRSRYAIPAGEKGVCVVLVKDQAQNSGIKVGDLLKSINGKSTLSIAAFLKVARDIDIRQGALLDILRNRRPLFITLQDKPAFPVDINKYIGMDPRNMSPVALTAAPGAHVPAAETAWLGLDLEPGTKGLLIDAVLLGSVAQQAGFMVGDIITAIDGTKVKDIAALNKVTLNGKVRSATVEVLRGWNKLYIFVQRDIPRGVGRRVAFNFNQPLFAPQTPSLNPSLMIKSGPAASLPPAEGHWIGMETLNLTKQLALFLNIPPHIKGVVIDEAVMEAQDAGLIAGDVVVKVGDMNTFNLKQFRAATRVVASQNVVNVVAYRKGRYRTFMVQSVWPVGSAQMETAPMIRSGAVAPHRYRGACTNCHTIGKTGNLAKDTGDLLNLNAPPIMRGAKAPHRWRGTCTICHKIIK